MQTQTLGDELKANVANFKKRGRVKGDDIVKAAWDDILREMSKEGEIEAEFGIENIIQVTGYFVDYFSIFWRLVRLYESEYGIKVSVRRGGFFTSFGGPIMKITWSEKPSKKAK